MKTMKQNQNHQGVLWGCEIITDSRWFSNLTCRCWDVITWWHIIQIHWAGQCKREDILSAPEDPIPHVFQVSLVGAVKGRLKPQRESNLFCGGHMFSFLPSFLVWFPSLSEAIFFCFLSEKTTTCNKGNRNREVWKCQSGHSSRQRRIGLGYGNALDSMIKGNLLYPLKAAIKFYRVPPSMVSNSLPFFFFQNNRGNLWTW